MTTIRETQTVADLSEMTRSALESAETYYLAATLVRESHPDLSLQWEVLADDRSRLTRKLARVLNGHIPDARSLSRCNHQLAGFDRPVPASRTITGESLKRLKADCSAFEESLDQRVRGVLEGSTVEEPAKAVLQEILQTISVSRSYLQKIMGADSLPAAR
jgi:hypothetical protein